VAEKETKRAWLPGWLKTSLGTLAGLLSGAVMMYLSPLIDKALRPAKPVANFRFETQGLTVTFHNLSAGGSDGWWDFGDGAALEPFSAKTESYTHVFPRPDSYSVKLTLRNLLGEENERTVTLALNDVLRPPPVVEALDVVSISAGDYAPATFRVASRTRNADLAIWDMGDDRPLEFSANSLDSLDRFVTFKEPGGYKIKLTAVTGKQAAFKDAIVYVQAPPVGTLTAYLTVCDQATQVEKLDKIITVPLQHSGQTSGDVETIRREIHALPGCRIADYHIQSVDGQSARNLQLQLMPDQQSVLLTGELVNGTSLLNRTAPPTTAFVKIELVQERRTESTRPAALVTANVAMPGSVRLPMPALPGGWELAQRQLCLELHDGDQVVWKQSQGDLPHSLPLNWNKQHWTLTAAPDGNQLRVDLAAAKAASAPSAN
jgi:PKD repeat protein